MKQYVIYNATDGILASPDTFTDEEADQFIQDFPKRYEHQGYYLTANWERISPSSVVLLKQECDID